jgi:hypothetical protein
VQAEGNAQTQAIVSATMAFLNALAPEQREKGAVSIQATANGDRRLR